MARLPTVHRGGDRTVRFALRPIALRLALSFAVVILLLMLSESVAAIALNRVHSSFEDAVLRTDTTADHEAAMVRSMFDQQTGLRGYLLTDNIAFLAPYERGKTVFTRAYRAARAAPADATDGAYLTAMYVDARAWQQWAEGTLRLWQTGHRDAALRAIRRGEGTGLFNHFRVASSASLTHLARDRDAALRGSMQTTNMAVRMITALAVCAITLVLVLGWLMIRSILVPLRELQGAARRIASGNLQSPVRAASRDEIGMLATEMERMREQLVARHRIGALLASTLRPEDIFPDLAAALADIVPFDRFSISLIEPDGRSMVIAHATGVAQADIPADMHWSMEQTVAGAAVRQNAP